jgi:NADPH-dependent 2,4-dienoyl-CoA reductase/sulfur reductase-like enzyme/two-component sensor histidine kinase/rhodanese-related sulfurtransferase
MKKHTADTSNEPSSRPAPDLPPGLFSVLSHELKSPINSIESLLRVIADGFTGDVNQKTLELVQSALERAGEARSLIADLLNFEKYSTGRLDKREEELGGLVTRVFQRFKPEAAEKNASFSCRTPTGVRVIIEADAEGLSLAFANLLDNALKYSGDHGRIEVTLEADRAHSRATVSVADSGQGLVPADRERLFTPFFRAGVHKAAFPGTGLGLSIVKQIIEQHGGTIAAESIPARGTTFTVSLPLLRLEQAEVKPKRRVVIIGGVTAGPKAAARLRRLDEECEITIIEKSEFLSYAGCGIPSYLSGKVSSPKALMSTADRTLRDVNFFEHIKEIRILNKTLAERIDRNRREVTVRDLASGRKTAIPYDILVLATGAQSVVPPIAGITGEGVHSLYNIEDAERIKRLFGARPAPEVYIIGGGLIGVETAESLMAAGGRVTILERDERILKLFDTDISQKIREILSLKGVKVLTGVAIREIRHGDERSQIVTDQGEFSADLIILSAGVKPNAALAAAAGLTLGPNSGVAVDEHLRTSDPAVYAIGDCAETKNPLYPAGSAQATGGFLPLGSISTKMGRIAADNIAGRPTTFSGGIGTTMFKVFETSVARSGFGVEEAARAGFDPVSVVVSGLDRTHYDKAAEDVVLKVIADRRTKQILGAQGYGRGDLIARIEILACAVSCRLTLPEIFALDLGYFPAFNNPIDVLQTACIVLENKIDGLLNTISLPAFLASSGLTVVDVSPIADFTFQSIPGSVNLPLETLRGAPFPFPRDASIVLCSKTSSRAYEAYRYLTASGFTGLTVLEGGYIHYKKG